MLICKGHDGTGREERDLRWRSQSDSYSCAGGEKDPSEVDMGTDSENRIRRLSHACCFNRHPSHSVEDYFRGLTVDTKFVQLSR